MESFNIFDGELDLERDQPGFSWRSATLGDKIGAEKLGAFQLQSPEYHSN